MMERLPYTWTLWEWIAGIPGPCLSHYCGYYLCWLMLLIAAEYLLLRECAEPLCLAGRYTSGIG